MQKQFLIHIKLNKFIVCQWNIIATPQTLLIIRFVPKNTMYDFFCTVIVIYGFSQKYAGHTI